MLTEYRRDARDFVKEQRVRYVLRGMWFKAEDPSVHVSSARHSFVILSPSRNSLRFELFNKKLDGSPPFDRLSQEIDISDIKSIKCEVMVSRKAQSSQNASAKTAPPSGAPRATQVSIIGRTQYSQITILYQKDGEVVELVLYSNTAANANVWVDGLLAVIKPEFPCADTSNETRRYIEMFASSKKDVQMLNLFPGEHMLRDMALTPIVDRALISNDYAYR
jgi:hypothetical protein